MKTNICPLAPCRIPVRPLMWQYVALSILHNSRVIYNSEEFQMNLWNCLRFLKEQCWCLCWKWPSNTKLRLSLVCSPQLTHCSLWYIEDPYRVILLLPSVCGLQGPPLSWTSDFSCFVSFIAAFAYVCVCACDLVKFTGYCVLYTLYFSKLIFKAFFFFCHFLTLVYGWAAVGDADSAVRCHLVFGFCGKDEVSTVRFALW